MFGGSQNGKARDAVMSEEGLGSDLHCKILSELYFPWLLSGKLTSETRTRVEDQSSRRQGITALAPRPGHSGVRGRQGTLKAEHENCWWLCRGG